MKDYRGIILIAVLLTMAVLLTSCSPLRRFLKIDTSGRGGGSAGSAGHGPLLSFTYSPGYSDMEGGYHYESLECTDAGDYVLIVHDQESFHDSEIITTYAVTEAQWQEFSDYLLDNDVAGLSDRRDIDDFALDWSPWHYTVIYDDSAYGGTGYDTYGFGQYKAYSDHDHEIMKELDQMLLDMEQDMISQETVGTGDDDDNDNDLEDGSTSDGFIGMNFGGTEDAVNDPVRGSEYDMMDQLYLGSYQSTDGKTDLLIGEADVQTGGYSILMENDEIGSIRGYANIQGSKLCINQAEDENGRLLYGMIYHTDEGICVEITESDSDRIREGDQFLFEWDSSL